ncbi:MAG TPA: hypothetical protein VHK88_01910, partial [Aquihabitans sp.]|nr:hypothetical protein [Aquihabitans sp.]
DDKLGAVTDGDPASTWRTEKYEDRDGLAGKEGVGLVATTTEPADLEELVVTTPVGGWTAQVYVAEGFPPGDLAGWGDPVAEATDVAAGEVTVDLGGRTGNAVLVWFTRLAPFEDRFAAQIGSLELRGS